MIESPPTSLSLLDRLGTGSADGWERMVALYEPLIRAWLRSRKLQPADVDDLTQVSLAVIVRRVSEFRHNGRIGAFRTWLRLIVSNALRDHLRTRGRRARPEPRPPSLRCIVWWGRATRTRGAWATPRPLCVGRPAGGVDRPYGLCGHVSAGCGVVP